MTKQSFFITINKKIPIFSQLSASAGRIVYKFNTEKGNFESTQLHKEATVQQIAMQLIMKNGK